MRRLVQIIGLVVLGMVMGCGETPPPKTAEAPPQGPPPPAFTPQQEAAVQEAQQQAGAGVSIDDEILRLCPAVKPPRFDYDSAQLKTAFRTMLTELAKCMKEGGLKGKDVLMIGHADPRGEEDYNLALGGRRADSVRNALTSLGVSKGRMDVSSRGEVDATGTDDSSWAKDRRVDIKLKAN